MNETMQVGKKRLLETFVHLSYRVVLRCVSLLLLVLFVLLFVLFWSFAGVVGWLLISSSHVFVKLRIVLVSQNVLSIN